MKHFISITLICIGVSFLNSCKKEDVANEDCDSNNCTEQTWYLDNDSDGYGDLSSTKQACEQPTGYVLDNTDCDDTDFLTNPGAPENTTDGKDNNCNGDTDECIAGVKTVMECSCTDGIDNDWDGDTDSADSDC